MRRRLALMLAFAVALGLSACSSCKRDEGARASAGPLTSGGRITIPIERAGYVTNNGSDSISVFDRDGETVIEIPLDLDPSAHEAPHHLALDPARGEAFVALAFPPAPGKVKRKDPHATHGAAADEGKVARVDLATLAVRQATDVDENPGDVVLAAGGTKVLVTHFDLKRAMDVAARGAASPATMFARLLVLDARTLAQERARPICTAPHGIAPTRDGKTAYIACYGSDELAVVDLSSAGLTTTRVPLGGTPGVPGVPRYGPYSATLSPDESVVVVANLEGQDVRFYAPADKRFVNTVPLAAKAFMPAFFDERTLLVPTQSPDGVVRIDVTDARVVTRVSLEKSECGLPHVVVVASDGSVYLVCEGDHVARGSVLELDPATLTTKRRWQVGVYPDGLALGR